MSATDADQLTETAAPAAARHRVPAIDGMMDLLGVLEMAGEAGLSIRELCARTDNSRSTAYRILNTLASHGMVLRAEDGQSYCLGPRLVSLAAGVPGQVDVARLRMVAGPILAALTRVTGASSKLSKVDGRDAMTIEAKTSDHDLAPVPKLGGRFPLHIGAASNVLLAYLSDGERDAYLAGPLERPTGQSLAEPEKIRARLDQIRVDGFAWTFGEWGAGLMAVAAPVFGVSGDCVAAVSAVLPPTSGKEQKESAQRAVCEAAEAISAGIGAPNARASTTREK